MKCLRHLALCFNRQQNFPLAISAITQAVDLLDRFHPRDEGVSRLCKAALATIWHDQGNKVRKFQSHNVAVDVILLMTKV